MPDNNISKDPTGSSNPAETSSGVLLTTELVQTLVQRALQVRLQAYAPYSEFLVGSALLTSQGQIFVGCNVENASYGLAICAERSAITSMVAAGNQEIVALAVASRGGAAPCGACRQVIFEFGKSATILLANADDATVDEKPESDPSRIRRLTMSELLPLAFGPDDL